MILRVAMACHNRVQVTIKCLTYLYAAVKEVDLELTVFLYDDASTDGTAEQVKKLFSDVVVVEGSGSAYWGGGMAVAEELCRRGRAQETGFIMWLNDDVLLHNDSIKRACQTANPMSRRIYVGTVRSSETGILSYGGYRKVGAHPLAFHHIEPSSSEHLAIDAFNGNFVLVPFGVAHRLGGIDPNFRHLYADLDYGLRAARIGVPSALMPGIWGTCEPNREEVSHSWGSARKAWLQFFTIKYPGYFPSLFRFVVRHFSLSGLLFIPAIYLDVLWKSAPAVLGSASHKRRTSRR